MLTTMAHSTGAMPFKVGTHMDPLTDLVRRLCAGRRCFSEAWPKRCVLTSMLFIGFSITSGIRRSFTEAALKLTEESKLRLLNNETVTGNWTEEFIRSVQSSFTWGLLAGSLLGGVLSYKWPAHGVLAMAVALDSSLHLVAASVMQVHQVFLITLLFLQGFADGMTFPAYHNMLRHWAPPLERTRMFACGYAGVHFGSLMSYQISILFYKCFNSYTASLYFYGTIGILWVLPWFLLSSEAPSKHPTIPAREKIYIMDSLQLENNIPYSHSIPMKAILSSGPVWAILLASFCRTWTYNTLLHIIEWYYHSEIRYAIELPYLLMMITVSLSGYAADVLQERRIMTTSTVRKTFGGTGLIAEGVCFLSLVCVGPTSVAMGLYFFAMAVRELAVAGYLVNPLDVANHYAGIIVGFVGSFAALGDLTFYPMKKAIFNQWKIRDDHLTPLYAVSVISGGLQFLGALFYVVFSSGYEQEWARKPVGQAQTAPTSADANARRESTVVDETISLNVIVKR